MLGRDKIGEWFETGDRVTQSQFTKTHQSFINMVDDDMYADGNKNIGIGIDTPDTKLHINGDTSNENDEGVLKLSDSLGSGTNLRLGITSAYSWMQSHGAKPLKINPSGNNVILNENAGNVGIGESSPSAKLDIKGADTDENGHGVLKLAGSSGSNLRLGVTSDYSWIQSHGSTPLKINPHAHGNDVIINEHAGNVGIGVSDPLNKLHINNPTGSDTGIRLTNDAGLNKVLVSDSSGNASWKKLTDDGIAENTLVPKGVIVMWSGNVLLIPTGWDLCDGKNGTPDLKGRFIVGYDATDTDYDYSNGKEGPPHINTSDYTLEDNGKRVVLKEGAIPKHKHYVNLPTSDAGRHRHGLKEIDETTGWGSKHGFAATAYAKQSTYNTDYQEDHNHKVTGDTNSQGRDQSHENRPPYYVLAFIIKI